jgi:hypothetical protein
MWIVVAVIWPVLAIILAQTQGWWHIQRIECVTTSTEPCPEVITRSWQEVLGSALWFWPQNAFAQELSQRHPSFQLRDASVTWDGRLTLQYSIPPHLVQLRAPEQLSLTIDTAGQLRDEPSQAFPVYVDAQTWRATIESQHVSPALLLELQVASAHLSPLAAQIPDLSLSLQHPSLATISSRVASASAERAELARDLQKFQHLAPLLSTRRLPYTPATIDLRPRYPVVRPFGAVLTPISTASRSATPSASATASAVERP